MLIPLILAQLVLFANVIVRDKGRVITIFPVEEIASIVVIEKLYEVIAFTVWTVLEGGATVNELFKGVILTVPCCF